MVSMWCGINLSLWTYSEKATQQGQTAELASQVAAVVLGIVLQPVLALVLTLVLAFILAIVLHPVLASVLTLVLTGILAIVLASVLVRTSGHARHSIPVAERLVGVLVLVLLLSLLSEFTNFVMA